MVLKMPDQASRIFFERAIKNRHVKITMRTLDIWCTTYNLERKNYLLVKLHFPLEIAYIDHVQITKSA